MATIEDVSHLLKVMKQLRDPVNGCAWDLEQDHSSLIPYLEEESQELIKAIESNDSDGIKEELGDVLLQVIFHSQIAHENKEFDFYDVVKNLKQKLIRRHPYVFDKSKKHTKEEQKAMWEKIKRAEKGG
jgi:MazG family protein